MQDFIHQFKDYLEDYDLYPNDIIVDGKIHRFSTNGNTSDKAGWYVLFDNGDDLFAGKFGDFRTGIEGT